MRDHGDGDNPVPVPQRSAPPHATLTRWFIKTSLIRLSMALIT